MPEAMNINDLRKSLSAASGGTPTPGLSGLQRLALLWVTAILLTFLSFLSYPHRSGETGSIQDRAEQTNNLGRVYSLRDDCCIWSGLTHD